ncbi:hypothetical protein [Caldicellulosiruptor sp. DIB 104C]|uniref:hypothetical protein n=1 Tax=Caldicellulosiruptor sp. DIB 104C TaxID=3019889 RepID=UPI0023061A32|nr:hypothetical protein [Caldicellulosiruptor sp. DIB 104C]
MLYHFYDEESKIDFFVGYSDVFKDNQVAGGGCLILEEMGIKNVYLQVNRKIDRDKRIKAWFKLLEGIDKALGMLPSQSSVVRVYADEDKLSGVIAVVDEKEDAEVVMTY